MLPSPKGASDTARQRLEPAQPTHWVGSMTAFLSRKLKAGQPIFMQDLQPRHLSASTASGGLCSTWSSYGVESEGVMIAYTSVYGNTKQAVDKLAEILKSQGCPKVVIAEMKALATEILA